MGVERLATARAPPSGALEAVHLEKKLFGALPEELDPLGALELEGARFRLNLENRRYGKAVTVLTIDGWPQDEVKGLATDLKTLLGTGGTAREGAVELQGDHRRRVKEWLQAKGYSVDD